MRRIELPSALAFGTAERLHRLGVIPAPASDLQYVVHPWVVPVDPAARGRLAPGVRQPHRAGPAARAGARPPRTGRAAGRPARRDHRRGRCRGRGGRHRRPGAGGPAEAARMSDDGVLRLLDLRDEPLSVDEVFAAVSDPGAGGVALFVGTVREQDGGRAVDRARLLRAPGRAGRAAGRRRAGRRRPPGAGAGRGAPGRRPGGRGPRRRGRRRVPAPRRGVRRLPAAHRRAQARVPIWKHQVFDDGSEEWVGLP